jgi:hypothetical protein
LLAVPAQRESESLLQNLRLGLRHFFAYIGGVKRKERREKRPKTFGQERKTKMFATLKRAAKALRVPTAEEMDLAYIYEAGDRYDLEARERNLSRRNRGLGL